MWWKKFLLLNKNLRYKMNKIIIKNNYKKININNEVLNLLNNKLFKLIFNNLVWI